MLAFVEAINGKQALRTAVSARFDLDYASEGYWEALWHVHEHFGRKSARDFQGRKMDVMIKEAVRGLNTPRGKLLDTTLGLQCVFIWRAAALQTQPKYPDRESFLSAYPHLAYESEHDQQQLHLFAELVTLCLQYKAAKANKGWFMRFVPQMLEGRDAKYVTGSGQTHQTSLRVRIFEQEGGVQPIPRPERRSSNLSSCLSKRTARDAGVTDQPAWMRARTIQNEFAAAAAPCFSDASAVQAWPSIAAVAESDVTDASSDEQAASASPIAQEAFFADLLADAGDVWADLFDEPTLLPPAPPMKRQITFDDPQSLLVIPGVRAAPRHGPEPVALDDGLRIEDICTAMDEFSATFSWACESSFGTFDHSVSFPSAASCGWLGAEHDFAAAAAALW